MWRGDLVLPSTLNFKFTSISSGAPAALSSADVVCWKAGATSQSSTAGLTLTSTFGGIVGLNNVQFLTTGSTSFYVAGQDYQITLSTGSVAGISALGYVLAEFSVQNRGAVKSTDLPTNLSALVVSTSGIVDASVRQWMGGVPATTAGPPGSTDFTTARAVKLDNLTTSLPTNLSALVVSTSGIVDANVQQWRSGVPGTTAGPAGSTDYTAARAAKLDNLTTSLPTNLSLLVISTSGFADANLQQWRGTQPSTYTTWLASTEKPTNWGNMVVSTSGIVDANLQQWRGTQPSTYRDWLDSTDAPTNFVQLVVSTSGIVDGNVQQWRSAQPSTYNTWQPSTGTVLLSTATRAAPTSAPASSAVDIGAKVDWLYQLARAKLVQGSTRQTAYNSTDGAVATADLTATTSQVTRSAWA